MASPRTDDVLRLCAAVPDDRRSIMEPIDRSRDLQRRCGGHRPRDRMASGDPWDASVPILPFVCVILATCAAANGDRVALIVSVVAGSFVAQTYVGFAGPVVALWSFVFPSVLRLPGGRRTVLAAVGVL